MNPHFVRMSRFGIKGRFGNQLFQYAYLRIMAERLGADLELPDWVGQELFGLPRHPLSRRHVAQTLEEPGGDAYLREGYKLGFDADLRDADLEGYFQYHTRLFRPYMDQWKTWFAPVPELQQRLQPALDRLRSAGETIIGLHIRRGDYGYKYFYFTPIRWYLEWLTAHWDMFSRPVLFIASEDPRLANEFVRWNPTSVPSLGVPLHRVRLPHYNYKRRDLWSRQPHRFDFYPDFYLLSQCDVVLMPNSTYSFAAAMTGAPRQCWRSSLPAAGFVPIDPWDEDPVQRDLIDDYLHLDGISPTHSVAARDR